MYRTYQNLYRIRPSISSIGQGKQRIRLPKDVSITLDTVLLFFVYLLPIRYTVAPVFAAILFPAPWGIAIIGSAVAAYYSSKVDPGGKTVSAYLYGLVRYWIRAKWHDGWEPKKRTRRAKREKVIASFTLVQDGQVASLPAKGKVDNIELRLSSNVFIRNGILTVTKRGRAMTKPGFYRVEKRKLVPQTVLPKTKAPSLKRS